MSKLRPKATPSLIATTCAMATEKERVAKLESRAREAENALQQLNGYVELLKEKAGTSEQPSHIFIDSETRKLEAENEELRKEVFRLKQQLILEEIRNGVEQYPVPNDIISSVPPKSAPPKSAPPPAKQTTPSSEVDPIPLSSNKPPPSSAPTSAQPKKAKAKSEKKKGGGGGGGGEGAAAALVDVSRLDMRVGRILKAWKHPDADGLYVEEVDVGEEGRVRTVCSGLVGHVSLDQMQERLGIFLCNLKTAKMRGVPSEGMIMCASSPEKVEILDPPAGSAPGDKVFCVGYEGTPDAMLNPKKKILEQVLPELHTNEEGVACYKDAPFTVAEKGLPKSISLLMAEGRGAVELVKLQSSEGEIFEVTIRVARVSRTLSTMLEDLGHEPNDVIPLPNVNSMILRKVIGWAEHIVREGLDSQQLHSPGTTSNATTSQQPPMATPSSHASATSQDQMPFQPRPQPRVPQRPSPSRRVLPPPITHTLSSWEKEFLTRNKDNIYDLLLAANYLDIKSLLDVLCGVIADMIKGRDPQDIRKVFHASSPSSGWAAAMASTPPPGSRDSNCSFGSVSSTSSTTLSHQHRHN